MTRSSTLILALLGLAGCIESRDPANNDLGSAPVSLGEEEDAGRVDGGSCRSDVTPSKVAGTGTSCAGNAPTPTGGCYGFYCGTNFADIRAETPACGACGTDAELMEICQGDFAIKVAECARYHALGSNFQQEVDECVRADARWPASVISQPCLQCYKVSAQCALDNCIAECVSGDSPRCDKCREDKGCTPDFYACATMPDPQ